MIHPIPDSTLESLLAFFADEDGFVFLDTSRITAEEYCSYLFFRPKTRLVCRKDDSAGDFFREIENYLDQGLYLAGWFAYEFGCLLEPVLHKKLKRGPAGTLLASLGVYDEPVVFDHLRNRFTGALPWPASAESTLRPDFRISNLRLNESPERYFANIAKIKSLIEAGDTYQVNYTLKLLFSLTGSPEKLYQTLRRNQSVSYGAYLRDGDRRIMSFSPELFFKKEHTSCTVRPMKGTIRRGLTPEADGQLKEFLRHDPKNRSENIMIVDLLRNDLGRVCRRGSVTTESLFEIETYETLHQMTSTVKGTISGEAGLEEIFHSLFPCGSVTGAPKIRTMEIIHELEAAPRDIYTGAIGFITPARDMKFNVPIRTLLLAGNQGEMGIGSGVVYDSDPEKEWEECQLKGRFLTSTPSPDFQLIETILWQPGSGFWLLEEHLERLENSAAYFGFHFNRREIMGKLMGLAGGFATVPQRVRLTLDKNGAIALSATEWASRPKTDLPERTAAETLPWARFADATVDTNSPYIYHKTTRRDLFDRERQKALEDGCFEALFVNARGEVTEGSITNIFILAEGKILTPPIDCGLLNGVFRRYFLKNCPRPIEEKILLPKDLEQAEAVYLGNSVRGLVEVRIRKD